MRKKNIGSKGLFPKGEKRAFLQISSVLKVIIFFSIKTTHSVKNQSLITLPVVKEECYLSLRRSLSENGDFIIWQCIGNTLKCFQDNLSNRLPLVGILSLG